MQHTVDQRLHECHSWGWSRAGAFSLPGFVLCCVPPLSSANMSSPVSPGNSLIHYQRFRREHVYAHGDNMYSIFCAWFERTNHSTHEDCDTQSDIIMPNPIIRMCTYATEWPHTPRHRSLCSHMMFMRMPQHIWLFLQCHSLHQPELVSNLLFYLFIFYLKYQNLSKPDDKDNRNNQ